MANPGVSKSEIKATLAALKRCKWNQVHAAAELGIAAPTMHSRVRRLRAQGHKIPILRPTAARAVTGTPTAELKSALDRVRFLEEREERRRAVRPRHRVKPAKRTEEDRLIFIVPDFHGAKHSPQARAACLADMKRLCPWMVVQLGDLTDCGGFLAQHHTWGYVAEAAYTYEQDLAESGLFLDDMAEASGGAETRLIEGNHDLRPETWAVTAALRNAQDAEWLRKKVAPAEELNYAGRGIKYYRRGEFYDGAPIPGSFRIGKLAFTHGLIRGGGNILERFGTNVAFGHTHRLSWNTTRNVQAGVFGALNCGTLSELQPLWQHGDPNRWVNGYGLAIMSRSGNFQPVAVPIIDGVSLLPEMKL